MRMLRAIPIVCGLLLFSGQARGAATIAVVDGGQLQVLATDERVPGRILAQAGIPTADTDVLLFNGEPVAHDKPLAGAASGTLQIRRPTGISINGTRVETVARTVGEALSESGITLHAADRISPPAGSVISGGPLTIHFTQAQELAITADGQDTHVLSAAPTVGAALAEAGLPLLGLDYSKPGEAEPLPSDGHIEVVRVSESVVFSEKTIPFQSQFKQSADVELGQQQILQPGIPGLTVT
ncbi:MAG TPA: ubiquitin-like domain-containing protein, partial [Anaerolineales bacterium]